MEELLTQGWDSSRGVELIRNYLETGVGQLEELEPPQLCPSTFNLPPCYAGNAAPKGSPDD
jgi:hypothetical protein